MSYQENLNVITISLILINVLKFSILKLFAKNKKVENYYLSI